MPCSSLLQHTHGKEYHIRTYRYTHFHLYHLTTREKTSGRLQTQIIKPGGNYNSSLSPPPVSILFLSVSLSVLFTPTLTACQQISLTADENGNPKKEREERRGGKYMLTVGAPQRKDKSNISHLFTSICGGGVVAQWFNCCCGRCEESHAADIVGLIYSFHLVFLSSHYWPSYTHTHTDTHIQTDTGTPERVQKV